MQNYNFDNKKQIEDDLNNISTSIIKKIERNSKSGGISVNQLSDSSKMRRKNWKKYFIINWKNIWFKSW